jgi:hypothetical protein
MLSIDLNVRNIVLEYCWNIHLKKQNEKCVRKACVELISCSGYPLGNVYSNRFGMGFFRNDHLTSGNVPLEKTINKQVFPQAPSPTMTSFLLTSDISLKL